MLYNNYTNRIKGIVNKNHERKLNVYNGFDGSTLSESSKKMISLKEQREFSNTNQLVKQELNTIISDVSLENATIGVHPDFRYLKGTDQSEMHYIVSMFIDIEGSTNLHKEYELDEIFQITNTVQTAAIHTCLAMGGYVQRLQGDGVFAYFGGKSITKEMAVQSAMTACSMFTYFIKNDLSNVFLQDGIEDIKTRIGVDLGNDENVMWANFGVANVSELTTLSLHTSLASKMQAYAKPNGIVAGQNVKDYLPQSNPFFEVVEEKRYIFENTKKALRYTQYSFDWYKFLLSLPFVSRDNHGNLYLTRPGAPSILPSVTGTRDYAALGALVGDNKPYKI